MRSTSGVRGRRGEPKNKPSKSTALGRELVGRLARFAAILKNSKGWDDLAQKVTVREVRIPLGPNEYSAIDVLAARESLGVSQAVFARFLGVSLSAVRDWEQSLKPPNGAARRLMDEIRHNPEYFLRRLKELAR